MSALAPQLTKQYLAGKPTFLPNMRAHWPEVVGPYLARLTEPHKLSVHASASGKQAVLHLHCEPMASLEVQHMIPQVLQKVNLFCGSDQIHKIKLVQKALNKKLSTYNKPEKKLKPLSPEIEGSLEAVENESLREALKKLALQATS